VYFMTQTNWIRQPTYSTSVTRASMPQNNFEWKCDENWKNCILSLSFSIHIICVFYNLQLMSLMSNGDVFLEYCVPVNASFFKVLLLKSIGMQRYYFYLILFFFYSIHLLNEIVFSLEFVIGNEWCTDS
jgi:hypothetical protein